MLTRPGPITSTKSELHALIERTDLYGLLYALAEVCHEKAQDFRHELNLPLHADLWRGNAEVLERARNDIKV